MASEALFGRRWAVTIGKPGEKGRSWDDLHITFEVEKSDSSSPNHLKLSIYNLSADSRAFIANKGMAVRLEAGYAELGPMLLFSGTLEKVTHSKEDMDWVSSIESADGIQSYRSAFLNESFAPHTSEATVIRTIASKMGVVLGELKGLPQQEFKQGRQISGPASRELDVLCKSRGLHWSIQDGVLQIVPKGKGLSRQAVLLKPDSGLIGVPEKTDQGVKLVSLLQGGINPGQLIQVETRSLKGLFIAERVTHSGDSSGQDWYTTIEAKSAS